MLAQLPQIIDLVLVEISLVRLLLLVLFQLWALLERLDDGGIHHVFTYLALYHVVGMVLGEFREGIGRHIA